MRFVTILACVAAVNLAPVTAADLRGQPEKIEQPNEALDLKAVVSRFLTLLEIRATFDVIEKDAIKGLAADQTAIWQRAAPSPGELKELDRLLLAEASYYLVGLRYLVTLGGAAFPGDQAEPVYQNDTLVRIDALERRLVDVIANGGDPTPILQQAEAIRALTEGYLDMPNDLSVFADHGATLEAIWAEARKGTRL
jgi:hypothetical protein